MRSPYAKLKVDNLITGFQKPEVNFVTKVFKLNVHIATEIFNFDIHIITKNIKFYIHSVKFYIHIVTKSIKLDIHRIKFDVHLIKFNVKKILKVLLSVNMRLFKGLCKNFRLIVSKPDRFKLSYILRGSISAIRRLIVPRRAR